MNFLSIGISVAGVEASKSLLALNFLNNRSIKLKRMIWMEQYLRFSIPSTASLSTFPSENVREETFGILTSAYSHSS